MTVTEMHNIFRLLLDRVEANFYKNILPEEIDIFLNDAQERFIKQRYGGNNPKGTSFEETEKRIDDLRTIVVPNIPLVLSTNQTGAKVNGIFFDLPADYMFALQEEANISYIDCTNTTETEVLGFVGITLNEYNSIKNDPFTIPDPANDEGEYGKRFIFDRLEALTFGNFTINYYYLTYLRIPAVIDINTSTDSDLPAQTHREIVNIAVRLAIEAIESNRFQTNTILLNEQE